MSQLHIEQKKYEVKNAETDNKELINIPCAPLISLDSRQESYENSVKGIYNNIKETKSDIISKIQLVNDNVQITLNLHKDNNNLVLNNAIREIKDIIDYHTKDQKKAISNLETMVKENTNNITALTNDNIKRNLLWAKVAGVGLILGICGGYIIPLIISKIIAAYSG